VTPTIPANQQVPVGTPIVDGLTLNTRIVHLLSYYHNCLSQLEDLRRASGLRFRMLGVPDPQFLPIPPYEVVEQQMQVQPGSYLWGWNFWASQSGGMNPVNAIRIVDSCTELPIIDRPVLSTLMANANVNGQTQLNIGQNRGVILLAKPYLVGAPGLINVEITNGANASSQCQLLLMLAEPCLNEQELQQAIRKNGGLG
jgi:hypothetical protein